MTAKTSYSNVSSSTIDGDLYFYDKSGNEIMNLDGTNRQLEIPSGSAIVVGGNTLSTTELSYLDGLTIGTVTASKAVVVDANKDIGDFRNLDAVNLDAGASGTAGTVDIFPATASKGKIQISAADSAGDTTTTITNASMAGARTFTVTDPVASSAAIHPAAVFADGADGAITIKNGTVMLTKAGVEADTLAAPVAGTDDGKTLVIIAATANAHTVTQASPGFNNGGAGSDVATFGGAVGDSFTIRAYQGVWYVVDLRNVTLG